MSYEKSESCEQTEFGYSLSLTQPFVNDSSKLELLREFSPKCSLVNGCWTKEGIENIVDAVLAKRDDEYLDLQIEYTADEYGEESRKLGLIKYAYDGDAGIDLFTVLKKDEQVHGLTVFPGDRIMLHTGFKIAFPKGYWGRIIHRSSTERRHRLRIVEGVIDQYRGELLVQIHNMNTFPLIIENGQKLGQLIVAKVCKLKPRVVEKLPPSERGTNGFGSSGI